MKQITFILTQAQVYDSPPGPLYWRWNSMVSRASNSPHKQHLISEAVKSDLTLGRSVLCLCDRLGLANQLYRRFAKTSGNVEFLQGSVSCSDRMGMIERLNEGKTQLLISTKVIEAFDASIRRTPLNTLHLVTPISVTSFKQRIHLLNQEDVLVRYYVDWNDWLTGTARKMGSVAEKLGWEVETLECDHYLRRERNRRDEGHGQETSDNSPPGM